MILLPIGTDVRLRRAPMGNYGLIAANVLIFLFTDVLGTGYGAILKEHWTLDAQRPLLWQYVTYQFLHGDIAHLAGNMIFLWIFGNAVCDRMGNGPYLLFYLAGGVFAGVTFATAEDHPIVGASGAIAAVTTAFLVLFPRVHIHMILWIFVLLQHFTLPSMLLIVFKIILWDNVLAPALERQGAMSNVAYSAHLGGYAFGFLAALTLLMVRAMPRNSFDLAGVWSRWRRRSALGSEMPVIGIRTARPVRVSELESRPLEALPSSPAERAREELLECLRLRDYAGAAERYPKLRELVPGLVLPPSQQLEMANYLAQTQSHAAAADAYQGFLEAYPQAREAAQVHLFLGMLLHRYLGRPTAAIEHLSQALERLTIESHRSLAFEELQQARRAEEPA